MRLFLDLRGGGKKSAGVTGSALTKLFFENCPLQVDAQTLSLVNGANAVKNVLDVLLRSVDGLEIIHVLSKTQQKFTHKHKRVTDGNVQRIRIPFKIDVNGTLSQNSS
jgi:hypothetical protein